MEFQIEKERTFNCPEGAFRARFKGIRPELKFKDGRMEPFARLTLEVNVPGVEDKIVTVARSFPPSRDPGTKLRQVIESWLGKEFFQQNAGKKIDLNEQMDKEADILVNHIKNPGHRHPYCWLSAMYPPGTLPRGENEKN